MNTLLQSQTIDSFELYWIAGATVVFLIAFAYYRKVLTDRAKRDAINHDPRSHIVNDSNYNIAHEGIDGHRDQGMNEAGAEEAIDKMIKSDTIPSREEFYELREDIRKN